ncbi:MAG: MiaB/RimO family radical SAM methylthiotransferase [Candidatus Beckwithbacteria bacterium]|nr:MiaB/RimO family radical SAM methylthiotransferase [Candidatus Beckwithbacteria bacterium]
MKKTRTYFIYTFGCQMNKADSERIAGDYQKRGFKPAKNIQTADEIIINTCSVRKSAEDRVIGLLLNLAKNKGKKKIILTGCMIHYGQEKLLDMLPAVDEILPINEVGFNQASIRRDQHHAWVPISNGCNSFCSYCIVPYSRGRETSRPELDILVEIRQLVEKGYTEITLLGQNVNSYGLDKVGIGLRKSQPRQDVPPFVQLLEKVCRFNQLKLIRFMTSNPWDFSDALIDCIAKNKKIDRYVHLPVQSGSNRILKLMNRGYTWQDYLKLVKKLKTKVKGLTLGTDIIVGFPGETEADFQATVNLANQVNWQIAFVNQYSPRPGTAAAKIPDDVSAAEKKRRWQILEKLINLKHFKNRPKVIK